MNVILAGCQTKPSFIISVLACPKRGTKAEINAPYVLGKAAPFEGDDELIFNCKQEQEKMTLHEDGMRLTRQRLPSAPTCWGRSQKGAPG